MNVKGILTCPRCWHETPWPTRCDCKTGAAEPDAERHAYAPDPAMDALRRILAAASAKPVVGDRVDAITILRTYGEECRAAEREKWEPDARRYRWLRQHPGGDRRKVQPWAMVFDDDLERYIDAAIREARHD